MELLYSLLVLVFFTILAGQEKKEQFGKPVIVLIEYDPWAMAIGADTPTFALYEDGTVIYKDLQNGTNLSIKLSLVEKEDLLSQLNIGEEIFNLPENINTSDWTDQPTISLTIFGVKEKTISVYGALRDDDDARDNTPESFIELYDKIVNYKNENAKEWLPEKIEVMVWDYSHSRGKSLKWPGDWPDLDDANTVDRGGMFSIYLDNKYYNDLLSLLRRLKDRQSVEINGKKFTVQLRFPFPGI